MAGIIFTNQKLFLAGYKSFKGYITGIGGKQKDNESLFSTAIRETLEELLGIENIQSYELHLFEAGMKPFHIVENKGYTQYYFTFIDLTLFLKYTYILRKKSPYYDNFPVTIEDLLLERKNIEDSEISHLALLPFVKNLKLASHLADDINLYEMPVSMR
jgi:8-oxo-dGTP pyrophosphatase MutT (NUDIX family)